MARPTREDIVNYADFVKETQRPAGASARWPFRFNWRAPLVMSPHNPLTLYLGGNFLFRTVDGGQKWRIISPDLSTNDPAKFLNEKPGGLTRDATGAEEHCSITAVSESPLVPGVIWVGTDDGNVQVTRDGGVNWTNVRGSIPSVPTGTWVSNVEAGHFAPGIAYVSFDGHRSSDFRSWLFKTTDYGATWTDLSAGFPKRTSPESPHGHSLYVVREDLKNPNLLFAGSEFAMFVSLDAGRTWKSFTNGLPTVAVHDIVIHPRDRDLVIGTHGRGIYVLDDVTPLEQLTDAVRNSPAHLFEQRPATIWEDASRGGTRGHFFWAAENPPYIPKRDDVVRAKMISGALINYYLKETTAGATLEISDLAGAKKRTLLLGAEPGIGRVLWDLRWEPPAEQSQQFRQRLERAIERLERMTGLPADYKAIVAQARRDLTAAQLVDELSRVWNALNDLLDEAEISGVNLGPQVQGEPAAPGEYLLKLNAGGQSVTGKLIVRPDPLLSER